MGGKLSFSNHKKTHLSKKKPSFKEHCLFQPKDLIELLYQSLLFCWIYRLIHINESQLVESFIILIKFYLYYYLIFFFGRVTQECQLVLVDLKCVVELLSKSRSSCQGVLTRFSRPVGLVNLLHLSCDKVIISIQDNSLILVIT